MPAPQMNLYSDPSRLSPLDGGSSIFDGLFKSKNKAKAQSSSSAPKATSLQSSSASISSSMMTLDKEKAKAVHSKPPLTFLRLATRGFDRTFPKPKY